MHVCRAPHCAHIPCRILQCHLSQGPADVTLVRVDVGVQRPQGIHTLAQTIARGGVPIASPELLQLRGGRWCAAETRVIGRSLFLTFAMTFREEVGGILKNVDPATALKLQRSLRDIEAGAASSASHRGPFGGMSSATPSSRGMSRPGVSRPSRLQTTPTTSFAGQRSRPPSHSPGIKSRYSSAPGMQSDSRQGMNSVLPIIARMIVMSRCSGCLMSDAVSPCRPWHTPAAYDLCMEHFCFPVAPGPSSVCMWNTVDTLKLRSS